MAIQLIASCSVQEVVIENEGGGSDSVYAMIDWGDMHENKTTKI
jgi:hypothetical protein